jgi:non-ribosomal peptide synthetase component F
MSIVTYASAPAAEMSSPPESSDEATRGRAGRPGAGESEGPTQPLTREQQTLWRAQEADLRGEHHRLFIARLRSRVEGERLELALERVVMRHRQLHATFHVENGEPVRRVRAPLSFQLEFVDARRWGPRELREIVRLTSCQPMDLSAAVLRGVLFTRADDDHVLMLMAHRIAVDEPLMQRLIEDLRRLYDGEPLPPLVEDDAAGGPVPRADVADALLLGARTSADWEMAGNRWSRHESVAVREVRVAHAHGLFEEAAAAHPDRPAFIEGGRTLTYGELDRAANRLARRLRAAGVDPRVCVAIDLPGSTDGVVAHLAVLKAGAVCLPCDIAALGDRASALIHSARVAALITRSSRQRSAMESPSVVIDLDADLPSLHETSAEPLGIAVQPDAAALVALRDDDVPAVPLTHEGILQLLSSLGRRIGISPADRVLFHGPLDARAVLLEVMLPLSWGATVIFGSPAEGPDEGLFASGDAAEAVTLMFRTGDQWGRLLERGWEGWPGLRALCPARELSGALAAALRPRVGELWSLYGYVETTLCSTVARIQPGEDGRLVGDALPHVALHLLDEQLQPVPQGAAGTLYVGGPGVVRGYVPSSEAAAGAILPDPYASDGRGFLFRTGDRARRRPDGRVELMDSDLFA